MSRSFVDIAGKQYGRLTATSFDRREVGRTYWNCECICGKIVSVRLDCLQRGVTKSCGCFNLECLQKVHQGNVKHGHSDHPLYEVWTAMLQRCENPNAQEYFRYGARGIKICDQWHDFRNFLTDVGYKPTNEHQLDRINNDGNYEPGNIKWSTAKEQAANRHFHGYHQLKALTDED